MQLIGIVNGSESLNRVDSNAKKKKKQLEKRRDQTDVSKKEIRINCILICDNCFTIFTRNTFSFHIIHSYTVNSVDQFQLRQMISFSLFFLSSFFDESMLFAYENMNQHTYSYYYCNHFQWKNFRLFIIRDVIHDCKSPIIRKNPVFIRFIANVKHQYRSINANTLLCIYNLSFNT